MPEQVFSPPRTRNNQQISGAQSAKDSLPLGNKSAHTARQTHAAAVFIRGLGDQRDEGLNPTAGLDESKRLLHLIARSEDAVSILRIYRPAPTVAFSRREERLPGFAEAAAEARAFGYVPVIRPAGGRMVALDTDWVVIDHIAPVKDRSRSHREVYLEYGDILARVLREFGVDARVGSVPGEYCPGDYSVNARAAVKIVGTAQRVSRGARLFSASIPLKISTDARTLFDRVNSLLELDWDRNTLGSLAEEAPALTFEQLESALCAPFGVDPTNETTLAAVYAAHTPPAV